MFGMIFDINWNEKQPINSSFGGVSGCRHTPFLGISGHMEESKV